jgi:hypothetical protein
MDSHPHGTIVVLKKEAFTVGSIKYGPLREKI